MNTNECSTCKHYKPVHAQNPRGDCTLYPAWLDVPAAHYCGQWASTEEEEEPAAAGLDIDWSKVPEGYEWVAQDRDGGIYAFTEKPIPNLKSSLWIMQDGETFSIGGRHPFNTDWANWANTLTKRPGT